MYIFDRRLTIYMYETVNIYTQVVYYYTLLSVTGQKNIFFIANDIQTCCLKGIEEANSSSDCRFRQIHLPDVSLFFRDTCHSIVEVCCLNQRAIDACEFGQRTALQQRDALHQRTCSANNYGSMNERFTVLSSNLIAFATTFINLC